MIAIQFWAQSWCHQPFPAPFRRPHHYYDRQAVRLSSLKNLLERGVDGSSSSRCPPKAGRTITYSACSQSPRRDRCPARSSCPLPSCRRTAGRSPPSVCSPRAPAQASGSWRCLHPNKFLINWIFINNMKHKIFKAFFDLKLPVLRRRTIFSLKDIFSH